MSNKNRVKPSRFDSGKLVMRFVDVQRDTVNTEARSVRVTVATENPVERYDEDSGEVIHEVLPMEGLSLRGGRNQLPIVDSHDRSTVANVLGSVRNLVVRGDELQGDAYFAQDQRSQDAFRKLADGHLDDFSITASANEIGRVERGKQYTTSTGQSVDGPADIMLSWTPTDASLVAAGADVRSTVHRSYTEIPTTTRKVERMEEALLKPLHAMGMPAELVEPDAILAWVCGNMAAKDPVAAEPIEMMDGEEEEKPIAMMEGEEPVEVEKMDDESDIEKADDEPDIEKAEDEEEIENKVKRALESDRKRCDEIRAICDRAGIERAISDALCTEGASLDLARKTVLERMAVSNQPIGQGAAASAPKATQSEDDKFYAAARDGLIQRAYQGAGVRRSVDSPASGSEDFRYQSLNRLAETFARRMGAKVERMAPKDIALVAMEHPGSMRRFSIQRDVYHTTGSFSNLMLDAANKSLLAAYEEAPFTWNQWARQASSVADFKAINRIRYSEVGNPEMIPEGHDYPEATMSDSKESYSVEKYGNVFTVTWETVVNDDLDAISRTPAMQGTACRRKQNATVYGVLTANAAMADTGNLFNATAQTTAGGHANLASSAAAPSVTTLNAGFLSMMTKTGLNSDAILNLQPAHLIVPAAHSATAMQLLGSIANPTNAAASTEDATRPNYNSNTLNIYGPNGQRGLNLIVEPVLDGNSATAWYLAASSSQVDTVELSFLQGEESPVLENEWDFDRDYWKYKVRQTWGVAAIDFRGLYKNAGA